MIYLKLSKERCITKMLSEREWQTGWILCKTRENRQIVVDCDRWPYFQIGIIFARHHVRQMHLSPMAPRRRRRRRRWSSLPLSSSPLSSLTLSRFTVPNCSIDRYHCHAKSVYVRDCWWLSPMAIRSGLFQVEIRELHMDFQPYRDDPKIRAASANTREKSPWTNIARHR